VIEIVVGTVVAAVVGYALFRRDRRPALVTILAAAEILGGLLAIVSPAFARGRVPFYVEAIGGACVVLGVFLWLLTPWARIAAILQFVLLLGFLTWGSIASLAVGVAAGFLVGLLAMAVCSAIIIYLTRPGVRIAFQ
jgi:hypothetical protein